MATEKAPKLPPFVSFCTASVPMVFDNSLSYYECLCALSKYIQDLADTVNYNAGQLDGLNVKFDELKSYVDHYFDNLDVQDEINAKLDDMAEQGELTALIAAFAELNPVFVYNTLDDLIAADNLIAGNTARTLGKETLNDGYGAIYVIDETGDIALNNGLYATLKDNTTGNNYYNEITISSGRQYSTDYYVANIPLNDGDDNLIPLYVNDETDTHTRSTLQYAQDEFTTLTINAGLGIQDSHDVWQQGTVIANGVVTHTYEGDVTIPEWYSYIGFKADRSVYDFPADTTPETMLAAGIENAFLCFGQVVTNGTVTVHEHWDDSGNHPLVYLGVKNDGTMLIFTCDGRTNHDTGFTIQQGAGYMLTLGCVNAWRLDSGGSSSMVYKGSKQNRNIDDYGTKDRGIWVTLNFKKQTIDKQLAEAYSFIGKERQLLNKQIRDDVRMDYHINTSFDSFYNTNTGYNIISNDENKIIEFSNILRHSTGFENIIEEGASRATSFKVHLTGLIKVTLTATVKCANSAGARTLRIWQKGTTNMPNNSCFLYETFNPTAPNEYYQMGGTFVFNNATAGNEYNIIAGGVNGDDFSRIYAQIEYIGNAGD